jgi:uncharacterized protein YajQ (UPF0234 family)
METHNGSIHKQNWVELYEMIESEAQKKVETILKNKGGELQCNAEI